MQDIDLLGPLINDMDNFEDSLKNTYGIRAEELIKEDIFNGQGPETDNTDPLNPRSKNPQWQDLSNITVYLKGSSTILIDTGQLRNTVEWRIEDSDWDGEEQLVKIGWFESSGGYGRGSKVYPTAYIAAIHEFGVTGDYYVTVDGSVMGAEPISADPVKMERVRKYLAYKGIYLNKKSKITIPERSMIRKAADMLIPEMEDLAEAVLLTILQKIQQSMGP